jgi:hypothetical protein
MQLRSGFRHTAKAWNEGWGVVAVARLVEAKVIL